jgi:cytochrome c biogenesis factor
MYRYTFVASRDEWLAAQRASSRGDRQVRKLRLMMAGLFTVVVVLTLAGSRDLASGLRSQGLNLVLLGTVFAATGLLARFSTRVAMLVNPNIVGEKTVELNDTGVRWIGVGVGVAADWTAIRQAYETEAYFIIRASTIQGFFLPKRVIPPTEVDQVRQFIREHGGAVAAELRAPVAEQ